MQCSTPRLETGTKLKTQPWDGKGSLVEFILEKNLHRRDISGSQRAMVALEAERELAEEAKERKRLLSGTRSSPESKEQVVEIFPQPARDDPEPYPPTTPTTHTARAGQTQESKRTEIDERASKSREQAAKLAGTNSSYDMTSLVGRAVKQLWTINSGHMPLPKTPSRLPKVLARDQVYQQLRRWLIEGVLEPGEKLNYHDIGSRLGFSSIPIREACLRLHYEGFIEMAHSRWTRVMPLDVDKTAETCLAIEALELVAFELAIPHLKAGDMRQLKVLNESLRGALESGEINEAALADRALHQVWIDRSANQKVADLLVDLKDRLQIAENVLFGVKTHTPIALAEHDAMIDALTRSDTVKATRLLRKHWRARAERLQSLTDTKPDEVIVG